MILYSLFLLVVDLIGYYVSFFILLTMDVLAWLISNELLSIIACLPCETPTTEFYLKQLLPPKASDSEPLDLKLDAFTIHAQSLIHNKWCVSFFVSKYLVISSYSYFSGICQITF